MARFDSVTQLITYCNDYFESNDDLSLLSVEGELSGVTVYQSGHCYFTLKDANSAVSCVMFKNTLSRLDFIPKEGMKVVLTGRVNIYKQSGRFQLISDYLVVSGEGDLKAKYDKLFIKLRDQGFFAPEHKKKINYLPNRIGVITSPNGAVIRDIIKTLKRRNPYFDILIYPSAVQGDNCVKDVVNGINYFNTRDDIDVIIVARGGGSYEDLFAFNDEKIQIACYNSNIPVISAIGHETDNVLLDYVADLRAPTPTAAAELCMPKYSDLYNNISNLRLRLDMSINSILQNLNQHLDLLMNHKALQSPRFVLNSSFNRLREINNILIRNANQNVLSQKERLDELEKCLNDTIKCIIKEQEIKIMSFIDGLDNMSPLNVLKRGYSFITNESDKVISSISDVKAEDKISVTLNNGVFEAIVTEIKEDKILDVRRGDLI